ncbi:heme o synthase [Candidatus Zixiibacteriota bacterium]
MKSTILEYLKLTKPKIMLLVIFTGSAALVWEGSFLSYPGKFLLVLMGLYLTGGCANALNQYFEREIDAKMTRTAGKRPLPTRRLEPKMALLFSIIIGIIGIAIFLLFFNWLTALLSLSTILFYSLFYTLWLKPNTPQNIVIGGIAGAMSPVGAWTAATGHFDIVPWIMFAIIFLWTPPHFWMLALYYKDDYDKAELPMMPVIKGEIATLKQIITYTIILFLVSMSLLAFGSGWFYLIVAFITGVIFIRKVIKAIQLKSKTYFRSVFGYSILYLFSLFTGIIIDSFITGVR